MPSKIPTMPAGYVWVRGGPALARAGRNALFASDAETMFVWDDETGNRITDLLDQFGNPVTEVPISNGFFPGCGVPMTVAMPSFSVGLDGDRLAEVSTQTLKNATAALAPTDSQIAGLMGNASSATRVASDALYAPVSTATTKADKVDIPVAAGSVGADLAPLQTFLNLNAGRKVRLSPGALYSVAGSLTVPAGTRIDMQGATITQTASMSPIFTTSADGCAVAGGMLIGKASDYADTTATYPCAAVRATSGAKRVRLIGCDVRGFAGAAVYATDAVGVTVRDCTIVGVGAGGGAGSYTFTPAVSKDNAGVIFDGSTTAVWVVDNDISYTCQGVLGGQGTSDVTVRGNRIHDIGGQHGVYLNQVVGACIDGNKVRRAQGAGIKVQTQSGAPDCTGVAVTGNVVDTVGANGIIFTCATGSSRHRAVTVTGNTVSSAANDGIVLEFVEGGQCSGNLVNGARTGIRVTDVVRVGVRSNQVHNTTQDGILVQALTFATSRVTVGQNDVTDSGTANLAASEFGIRVAEAGGAATVTNVALDGNQVNDALGNVRYLIYVSTASQATFSFRGNTGSGATDHGFRGPATPAREWVANNLAGTLGRFHTMPSDLTVGDAFLTTFAAAAPASGAWVRGDRCWSTAPAASTTPGWVCVASGTPGTWKAMPVLSA